MRILFALVLAILCSTGAYAERQFKTLQPGDSLSVTVLQDPKLDRQMLVGPDGMISFPLVGQIRAQGMTPAGLERLLSQRLKDKYTEGVDVNVSLLGLGRDTDDTKPRIYVTGEVKAPGAYPIPVRTDIVQAIALAGGLSPFAAKHRIQVRRKVRGVDELLPFDYSAYQSGVIADENRYLHAGDIVIVPERGLFDFE
jgi:polysaccharide export outer membrane protein